MFECNRKRLHLSIKIVNCYQVGNFKLGTLFELVKTVRITVAKSTKIHTVLLHLSLFTFNSKYKNDKLTF